jgi:hypothetical protein
LITGETARAATVAIGAAVFFMIGAAIGAGRRNRA